MNFRIRRIDGVYRWFKTRAVPLRDPAGRILRWFGSNTDIEDFEVAGRLKLQLERMQLLDRTTHAIGATRNRAEVFEVVLRSLEENLGVDLGCICLYQAEPELLTVACIGESSRALARQIGLDERRQIEVDSTACRCVRGKLVYEARSRIRNLLPRVSRAAAAGACGRPAARGGRSVRRAGGRQTRGKLLQQRRLRIPAAVVETRGARRAPGASLRRAAGGLPGSAPDASRP